MLWFAPQVGSDAALIWGAGRRLLRPRSGGPRSPDVPHARRSCATGGLEGSSGTREFWQRSAAMWHLRHFGACALYAFIAVAGLSLSRIAQLCFALAVLITAAADGEKFLPRATPTSM